MGGSARADPEAERRRALLLLHCSHAALLRFEVQHGEGCEPLSTAQTLSCRAHCAILIERDWSVLRLELSYLDDSHLIASTPIKKNNNKKTTTFFSTTFFSRCSIYAQGIICREKRALIPRAAAVISAD